MESRPGASHSCDPTPSRDSSTRTGRPGRLRIGTSGWYYPHWVGSFYPTGLPRRRWLEFYGQHLDCVELNSGFYRFPEALTVAAWCDASPPGFGFALKAHRSITHRHKLLGCATQLQRQMVTAAAFGSKLRALLFQLPPRWRANPQRLRGFLQSLPAPGSCAFEFRDPDWQCPAVLDALREFGAGFCQFDLAGYRTPEIVTARLIYLRLHGPVEAYGGRYPETELRRLAERATDWRRRGHEILIFFDNDRQAAAIRDALRLRELTD